MVNRNNISGFLAGLFIGSLIGVGLTILLAPQSGQKTRRQIRDRSFELKDQVEEGIAGAQAQSREVVEQQTDRVKGAVDKAKDKVGKVIP